MNAMIHKGYHIINKGKFVLLALVCLLFGISERFDEALTYEQHCISSLTDHYYLIYFMIPLFLLICFSLIEDDSEVVIIRFGSYFKYFIAKAVSIFVIAAIFMCVQISSILLSGISLHCGNHWIIKVNSVSAELFSVLAQYFSTPFTCFILTTLYMFLGLCITGVFCMWLAHFIPKSLSIKIVMLFYVMAACNIKIPFLQNLPLTGLNHWIILHHNFTGHHRFTITIISSFILLTVILWTVKKHWQLNITPFKAKSKGIMPYYCRVLFTKKNILILFVVSMLLILQKFSQSFDLITSKEWIILLFLGHGTGELHMFSLLEMFISNGLPLYLLATFVQKITGNQSLYVTIRLNRRYALLSGILRTSILFIGLYGGTLILISVIGGSILGLHLEKETVFLLLSCTGLKLIDIFVQFLFMLLVYCITGQITTGFILMIVLNLLCILPGKLIAWLPFGISSTTRLLPQTEAGITIIKAYGVLFLIGSVILTWLRLSGHKKILNH